MATSHTIGPFVQIGLDDDGDVVLKFPAADGDAGYFASFNADQATQLAAKLIFWADISDEAKAARPDPADPALITEISQ